MEGICRDHIRAAEDVTPDAEVVQQISAVANLCHTITVPSYSYTTQMDHQAPWEDMRAYVECVHV